MGRAKAVVASRVADLNESVAKAAFECKTHHRLLRCAQGLGICASHLFARNRQ